MLSSKYLGKLHWFIRLCLLASFLVGVWLTIAYLLPKVLSAVSVSNASRFGIIFRNERWSGEIHVTGDIWALPGTTVIVSPGTKIIVDNGDRFNLDWLPWHLISGLNVAKERFGVENGEFFWDERRKISIHFSRLFAMGTKEMLIELRSNTPRPGSPYDFNDISFDSGILGYVRASNYRRLIVGNDTTIRDDRFENTAECAICADYSSPTIINNTFSQSIREYIEVSGGSPKISDNLFMASKGKGIVIDPKGLGSPVISHNDFEMPQQVAVELTSGSEEQGGVVSFNEFSGGTTITLPCDSRIKILQNQIEGVIRLANSGNCVGSMTIGPNYWKSTDTKAIIREKVVGKEAKFNVIIPSALASPPASLGRGAN